MGMKGETSKKKRIHLPVFVFDSLPRTLCTRAVWKVSSHFEYLENRSRGLDVTWQPVRGDLTVQPLTVTLPWG